MSNPPRTFGCTIDGCDGAHRARGLCKTHYMRWHRTGSPFVDGRIGRERDTRQPGPKPRKRSVEDAIKVTDNIVGTITLEQWKRDRASERAGIHVVKPQPRMLGGGDAA